MMYYDSWYDVNQQCFDHSISRLQHVDSRICNKKGRTRCHRHNHACRVIWITHKSTYEMGHWNIYGTQVDGSENDFAVMSVLGCEQP